MTTSTASNLVRLLRSNTFRVRTGLWCLSPTLLGQEADEAVRLGISAEDVVQRFLGTVPSGSRFIGLTPDALKKVVNDLTTITEGSTCCLVYNLDLLLAGLKQGECHQVWQYFFEGPAYRPRALLFTMPVTAVHLLPTEIQLQKWEQSERLLR